MPTIIELIKIDGDLEAISESLDNDPEQCTRKIDNEFPLLIASQYGRLDVVELLLENKCIMGILESFEIACHAYAKEIVSLHRAACHDIAIYLLAKMEELDLIKEYGAKLLLAPAYTRNFDLFTHLISKIENVNLPPNEYQPLMAAVAGRDPKIVELLIGSGADITIQKYGYTPLAMALKMQQKNGWEIDRYSEQIIDLLERASVKLLEQDQTLLSGDSGD